jgi:hypothetical protein
MYIMNSVVYEDNPHYDVWLKGIMLLPVFFLLMGIYHLITAQTEAAISMFAATLLMGAIYWAIFPRKYLILNSKIKIALGGPFSVSIPFSNLETAGKPKGMSLGINFATTFLSQHILEIKTKRGLNVNITPCDRELFLEHLNKALNEWRGNNIAK